MFKQNKDIMVLNMKMKWFLLPVLILPFFSGNAQDSSNFCGFNSIVKETFFKTMENMADSVENNEPVFVRTVVHVLYTNETENLSDGIIQEQLRLLNNIYRNHNIDQSLILPEFLDIAADVKMEFCLANIDPNGNPTNGIIRRQINEPFGLEVPDMCPNPIQDDQMGGSSAWDTDLYMNIWLVPIGDQNDNYNFAIPYTGYLPINHNSGACFSGAIMDLSTYLEPLPTNPENILAHELGHVLGMHHTFGDIINGDVCENDDSITDTPLCAPSFMCGTSINTCIEPSNDSVDNLSNVMNYACAVMFTPEQAGYMYNNLTVLEPTGMVITNGASCQSVLASNDFIDQLKPLFQIVLNRENRILEINLDSPLENNGIINILDTSGKFILKNEIASGVENFSMDTSALSLGLYFLELRTENINAVKRFILY